MKTTAKEHLKAKLSIKYCDGTRYDYLDDDEELLILKAMKSYASEQTAKYNELAEAYKELNKRMSAVMKYAGITPVFLKLLLPYVLAPELRKKMEELEKEISIKLK